MRIKRVTTEVFDFPDEVSAEEAVEILDGAIDDDDDDDDDEEDDEDDDE